MHESNRNNVYNIYAIVIGNLKIIFIIYIIYHDNSYLHISLVYYITMDLHQYVNK